MTRTYFVGRYKSQSKRVGEKSDSSGEKREQGDKVFKSS